MTDRAIPSLFEVSHERPPGDSAIARRRGQTASTHLRRSIPLTVAIVLYALLSLAAYWPILPGQGGRIPTCACGDPALQTWFLGWIPYALIHGHNPLFSAWTNYPYGVNLSQNTEMPLLGLLTAPLTLLVSPVASYNLLLWLAFPASAGAMFFVIRRWTGSLVGAFVAGLLYGFSAYTVGQGVGHVMLSFVPLPPLFFFQLHKLAVRQQGNPLREGSALGVICVAQFFIEPEIVATMGIMAAGAILILALFCWRAISSIKTAYFLSGLVPAAILIIVFCGYPLWFTQSGPRHFTGPVRPVHNVFHSDLLAPFIPTLSQHFAPGSVHGIGRKLGNVENGSYIGVPLFLLTVILAVTYRRDRSVLVAAAMAALAYLFSLGPRLQVWGHQTAAPLPFGLLARLPLLNNVVPSRFSLFQTMFVSILVALGISELTASLRHPNGLRRRTLRETSIGAGIGCLGLLAAVSLVPRWPYSSVPATYPTFLRSSIVHGIPVNSVVLTYPFPYYPYNQAMMWQSIGKMRFKEVGTYALIPSSKGTATPLPPLLPPTDVETFLINQEDGQLSRVPLLSKRLVHDLRTYLAAYDISTIIYDPIEGPPGPQSDGAQNTMDLFATALGPPETIDGVSVWFDAQDLAHGRGQ